MNEKKSKSWKQRKANIKLSEAEIAERQKDIDKLKARNDALNDELAQKIDRSSKLYASSLKLLERAETQLNNGNTKLAEKQLAKVSNNLKSDIVKSGIKK
jgi:chromosome segregation ATPase